MSQAKPQALDPDVLRNWVETQIPEAAGNWEPVTGDAGFRQYFRLPATYEGTGVLAVYAPPQTEKNREFVDIARYLRKRGVRVPSVYAVDEERGFMLIEDLGSELLMPQLSDENVDSLYSQVLMDLLHWQQVPVDAELFPPYDRTRLHEELCVFDRWFVAGMLEYSPGEAVSALLADTYQVLEDSALEQPRVIVHRDFHSRNILFAGGAAGFIDFQDAVAGPVTYDLVSLLRDCYLRWPQEQVRQWALAYGNLLVEAGICRSLSREQFLRWFDWMGLQRHIKVLGVFARLSLRDNKHGYLDDLPRVVEYVREVAGAYRELSAFSQWFEQELMPRVRRQPWMARA